MKDFVKRNFITGIVIILPISIFTAIIFWLYNIINSLFSPITSFYEIPRVASTLIVLCIVIVLIIIIGFLAKTRSGQWFFTKLEKHFFEYLPGYKIVKLILSPFIGKGLTDSFQSVVLADIWGNGTYMTAFVTDTSEELITVFVPTGPNPTSGIIYHVPPERVQYMKVPMDQVLHSVIAVGAGSNVLTSKIHKKKTNKKTRTH
jgi:uncharacterized membrane protein